MGILNFPVLHEYKTGHPTNLFLTLSVPQRNLAGWQKYRCFDELAGKFTIDRGFAWELLTFSSISTRAGCRNSEDWGRLKKKKKKKKKNPFPLPESSHKHTTAGQSDCPCGKKPLLSRFCRFCSVVLDPGIWKRAELSTDRRSRIVLFSSFTCKINFHCYFICMLRFSWCSSTLNWNKPRGYK